MINYFNNSGLWLDESMLALNLLDKSFVKLLLPLDFNQVAPILFLWFEKLNVIIFGTGELALRLFPLTCSILSLPLLYLVASNLLKNQKAALIALFIFAVTPIQVRFSAETKQYMTDVFIILLLLRVFGLYHDLRDRKSMLLLAFTGSFAIFLSNIAVIVLFMLGIFWLFKNLISRRCNPLKFVVLAIWMATFVIYYYYFIADHKNESLMLSYWVNNFLPLNPFHLEFWNFLYSNGFKVFFEFILYTKAGFSTQMNNIIILLFLALYAIALIFMITRRDLVMIYFLTFPILVHLLLSGFRMYPFDTRLALYFSPLVIMTISYGIYQLYIISLKMMKARLPGLIALMIILSVFPYKLFTNFPVEVDGARDAIYFINKNYSNGQKVYISFYTLPMFQYYEQTSRVTWSNATIIKGAKKDRKMDFQADSASLKNLDGEAWLLFAHLSPKNEKVHRLILKELEQRGQIKRSFHSKISAAYLFDFRE